ncbi:Starch-binding associating with outer membrane [Chitinophaga costaii]|uniref:Starch-binding associating with outer membrane n=1 Tax=Chitinophaga costaii TaxID=1335309 RepID=A0A1C4BFT1_9BACT|nr:RagB/SusD family nutrient uptake outer membrane protein [Chitinophaga costaii]PUZ27626.1 RagB/SusD family nutrient uptake outer membrane protein [Chitinophaga costaii]SCC05756.1 Starch-binding associating with outer membrane [Chitinophaga costaii]
MKKSFYIFGLSALTVGMTLFSCSKSYLEKQPTSALSIDKLATPDGVRALLIGAYAALDGQAASGTSIGGGSPWEAAPSNWIYGSIAGGDAHKGSNAIDQPPINQVMTGVFDPANGFFNSKWKAVFEGITRCNTTLAALANTTGLTADEATVIKGEARFLRAHYYFELKKMFKRLPWIDENTTDFQQPADDSWSHIEDDMKFAADSLGDVAANNDAGRANKWAAIAYLGKIFLYEHNYAAAKTEFDLVIANGKTATGKSYTLDGVNFEDNFNPAKKNNSETVFDIQMTANNGTNQITKANQGDMLNFPYNSPFGCCGFYQPSQDLVNSYLVDASTGLPLNNNNATIITNDMGLSSAVPFTLDTHAVDPRLDWTVGRRGVPYLDWGPHPGSNWIRQQDYAGPYAPKKNVYYQATQTLYHDAHSWAPGTAINIHVIRFADVLLMAAEAEIEAGSLEKARTYINQVRERANRPAGFVSNSDNIAYAKKVTSDQAGFNAANADASLKVGDWVVRSDLNETWVIIAIDASSKVKTWNAYKLPVYKASDYTVPFASQDAARTAVRLERKLELAMEGQRYFDLVRWGIAPATMNAYYAYESKITTDLSGANFPVRDTAYPIPQRQIDLGLKGGQETLTQNPGY